MIDVYFWPTGNGKKITSYSWVAFDAVP